MIGQPVLRREDRGLLVGQGRYVSDVPIGSALSDALGIAVTECPVRAEMLVGTVRRS
jgi:hypothetical protein